MPCIDEDIALIGQEGCQSYIDPETLVDKTGKFVTGTARGVANTVKAPFQLGHALVTDPSTRADLARGWGYATSSWENFGNSLYFGGQVLATPGLDVYYGIVCDDPERAGEGFGGFATMILGRPALKEAGGWLRSQFVAGQRLGIVAKGFSNPNASLGNAPDFIATPNGDVIPIPKGATGPQPAVNGKGVQYTGGTGGNGLHPNVSGVRIMEPTPPKGPSPGYPNGYASYFNSSRQTVNPFTGKTIPRSDPMWHIPLK